MIFNMIGIIIGALILLAGIYYLGKEKHDLESRKIYGITTVVGAVIVVFMIVKIILKF